jgi:uncharacterized protein
VIHPSTELRYKSDVVGYAVYATRPIPRGTVVWTLCPLDQRITASERALLPATSQRFVDYFGYVDGDGDFILCWDHGRFVNHSCVPTMMAIGQEHEIAVRDIAAGEELTCDYGTLNLVEPLGCLCRHAECRGTIGTSELGSTSLAQITDDAVAAAIRFASRVDQPLVPYMIDAERFRAMAAGTIELPSVRLCDASSAVVGTGSPR